MWKTFNTLLHAIYIIKCDCVILIRPFLLSFLRFYVQIWKTTRKLVKKYANGRPRNRSLMMSSGKRLRPSLNPSARSAGVQHGLADSAVLLSQPLLWQGLVPLSQMIIRPSIQQSP